MAEEKKRVDAKFTEACFLMDYIDLISDFGVQKKPQGYKNFKVVECNSESAGGAHQIVSKLTSRAGLEEFLNISPAALAVLQPKVRLFKQIYGSENSKTPIAEPEFIFDDFYSAADVDKIFQGREFRIGGVGLKEVSWKLAGTNPAEADKVINVDMTFEFQTAKDLLGDRIETDGSIKSPNPDSDEKANMIDLILHPPGFSESQGVKARVSSKRGDYVPKFYRIRMDIGWADPFLSDGKFPGMSGPASTTLKRELKKQEMSIILNLVSHKFDIQENGRITLSVEYIGALEESINGNAADILSLMDKLGESGTVEEAEEDIEIKRQRIADMEEYIECLKLNETGEDEIDAYKDNIEELQDEIKDTTENIEELTSEKKGLVYKQFLTHLNEKVYNLEVTEDEILEWVESINEDKERPSFDGLTSRIVNMAPESADDAEDAVTEAADEGSGTGEQVDSVIEESRAEAEDPSKGYINFLFFGDIMEAAFEVMNPTINDAASDSAMFIGPVVINHPRQGRILINAADIPISYSNFQAFFFETVVRKQLASYPLKQFIKDVLERLVKKTLQPSECFEKGREQRAINISLNNFTMTKKVADLAGISNLYSGQPTGRLQIEDMAFDVEPPSEGEELVNCMLFYMNSYIASELVVDQDFDRDIGIYHFYIGAESGIVKSIDYSRTDVEGLREARQAEVRNLGEIRDGYNASVTLAGNSLFYPGMKVFLNPPLGFGRPEADGYDASIPAGEEPNSFGSMANLLGIGGYYDVITVESSISRGGQYETTLDCIFAQSGGRLDSVEAKCENVLSNPPERDIGAAESVTNAVVSVLPF